MMGSQQIKRAEDDSRMPLKCDIATTSHSQHLQSRPAWQGTVALMHIAKPPNRSGVGRVALPLFARGKQEN